MREEDLFRVAGLALEYPSEDVRRRLAEVAEAVDDEKLRRAIEAIARDEGAEAKYVELFDFSPERSLYLTYHFFGDTRRRGAALVELKRLFKEAGVELGSELPDYLPKLLELAAERPDLGKPALERYRAALEKIRRGCAGTPYAVVLSAVLTALPPVEEGEVEKIMNPPVEEVGLDKF